VGDETGDSNERDQLLSVAQLTALIKGTLEDAFPSVWVVGEIGDLARPRSGHIYLTLKDQRAQIRAVLWRGVASQLRFELEDGMQVVCRGDIDVYPPRGSYQLVIRQLEPRGQGSLQRALRELQRKLAAEGLFDPQHKQPLPQFPRRVAVITSPTGAAVRDFLELIRQRWQGAEILIIPVRVQGAGATREIAEAISLVNHIQPAYDVMVLTRGGGSIEDLWCFNEELVVRAIFESRVPVVSAIGHEIDVTLSDLAADVRAATPTEAAQKVVPSAEEVAAALKNYLLRLQTALMNRATFSRTRLEAIAARRVFRRPMEPVRELERRLDELHIRSIGAMRRIVASSRQRIEARAAQLESLSPLAVLARGYSLTLRESDGNVVRSAEELAVGETIRTRFESGSTNSRVESIQREEEGDP
jgi:exodeoxyribonuclease VII large subunit